MISFPENEILALSRDEAVRVLEEAGIKVEIEHTGPPGYLPPAGGREMVVRFRFREGTGIITVARQMKSEKWHLP
ncbi:MAG: hypothetical protein K6T65_06815 [Peptococcaceae bacterium]|nr:hypothetical protein [Peptococcaceae bacterium]